MSRKPGLDEGDGKQPDRLSAGYADWVALVGEYNVVEMLGNASMARSGDREAGDVLTRGVLSLSRRE